MTISFSNALGVHEQALLLRGERSQIIATNIANANTPGFKARDMDFASVLQQRLGRQWGEMNLQVSNPRHISGPSDAMTDASLLYRRPLQPSIDGNTVDEQIENANFARNALDHQASFQFLNGKFAGMMKALRGE
jgi:flagellar basal-body rod protein FlgB